MKKISKFFLLFVISVFAFEMSSRAQSKKEKANEELMKDAIEERIANDYRYARARRAQINSNLNYWVGEKLSTLVSSWGPPSRTTTDGGDGKIIIYENQKSGTTGYYSGARIRWNQYGEITDYTPAMDTRQSYNYVDYWYVYVDANNMITRIQSGRK